MRFVTFRRAGQVRVGRHDPGLAEVVDLSPAVGSMLRLIERFDALHRETQGFDAPSLERHRFADVELLAPIPRPPRNVFCVGKNYRDHAAEFARSGFDSSGGKGPDVPDEPIIFTKPPSSVAAPGAPVDTSLDPYASVDYEAELAVVIGRSGRVADGMDPMDFVFGYTLVNDVTARELQKRHKQWVLGKGLDGYCPMGPAIVHRSAMPELGAQELRCLVNGELRQKAPIRDLVFDVPTLVRTIGRGISFEPGDVIATGTPAGVGIGYTPPRYLNKGDIVRVELDAIGVLENPFV